MDNEFDDLVDHFKNHNDLAELAEAMKLSPWEKFTDWIEIKLGIQKKPYWK